MPQFHPLRVAEIQKETRDAVVVTLEPSAESKAAFRYIQGQYLTFKKNFAGEELRRSYSICSGVDEDILRVGIKKVDGGWFSTWANEELAVGDILEVMPPAGRFYTELKPEQEKTYVGFAGGSGITPVLGTIKTILATEPKSKFTLVYGNRSVNSIMFREALEDLKNQYMQRFSVIHILEQDAADAELFNGRVDGAKCDQLFAHWIDVRAIDTAFICGPEPMMLAVSERLQHHGLDKADIKFELFKSTPPAKARLKSSTNANEKRQVRATIILDGATRSIDMPAAGTPIVQAALDADIEVPFSCRAGVCSTCRAKVVEGEVEMVANYGLEDYEVEQGFVLTCQCYPLTDQVTVDYDQH
ncbi:MAG: 1,2-phenylacetyl-CoA epoxidase subunit PaaE [Pseudomonadota bacterium]